MTKETRFRWEDDLCAESVLEDCDDPGLLKRWENNDLSVLTCILETKCPACGSWIVKDSIGSVIVDYAETPARKAAMAEIEKQLLEDMDS